MPFPLRSKLRNELGVVSCSSIFCRFHRLSNRIHINLRSTFRRLELLLADNLSPVVQQYPLGLDHGPVKRLVEIRSKGDLIRPLFLRWCSLGNINVDGLSCFTALDCRNSNTFD